MPALEIRTFDEASLPEIGAFFARSVNALVGARGPDAVPAIDESGPPADFRWLLDEGNLARPEGAPAGEIIRDGQGAVVGMIGYHPSRFRYHDRTLIGLGAHNFYVDPVARMQGFFLFKRYLNLSWADFCYSTTCNANSGPLWAKCGAQVLTDSDVEYVRVFQAGPVLRELALRKGAPAAVARSLRLVGPLVSLGLRPRKPRAGLAVERSADWERLAAVAEQNRDPGRLTPERSAADLRRSYEAISARAAATGSVEGAFRFTDPAGREGWFTVTEKSRGRLGQNLSSTELLDVVWPHGSIAFDDVLAVIIDIASARTDILSLRDRSGWGLRQGLQGLRRRTLPDPEAFVYSHPRSGLPSPAELARIADFPLAYAV